MSNPSKKTLVKPVKGKRTDGHPSPKPSLITRLNVRLSGKERVLFARYLSVLQDSGLPLQDTLKVLLQQAKGPMKKILETLISEIDHGHTLGHGLSYYPHIFSPVFISLVSAGEQSGTLRDNLQYLADNMQREYDFKRNLQGAMMYPALILVGGLVVSLMIVLFVLPNIAALFDTLDVALPWTTRALLWVADIVEAYPVGTILLFIGLPIVVWMMSRLRFIRPISDRLILLIPVLGPLFKHAILSRLFRLLGILLKSGMPIEDALVMTKTVVNNAVYRRILDRIRGGIDQGQDPAILFAHAPKFIPPISQHLILVGTQTATLDKNLLYLASFYEHEVEETSKRISTLIEPLLIMMMGLMVAFIAFSVLSPIYQVVSLV